MNEKKMSAILKKAQRVFFRAILAGYAGGRKNNNLKKETSLFGFKKTNTYRSGDFIVIDEYTTTDHSDASSGTTTILFEEIPIWTMTYSGQYPKEVISFLKEALSVQYKKGRFRGGRGAIRWSSPQFIYRNHAYKSGNLDFRNFSGIETITNVETGEVVGFHEYSGMSMF